MTQISAASAELQRAKDAAEEEARAVRERLIKREQRLTATIQERAEATSAVQDLTEQLAALRKRGEKQRKEARALEDSLKLTRAEHEREYARWRAVDSGWLAHRDRQAPTEPALQ